jgi:hypothetical protein
MNELYYRVYRCEDGELVVVHMQDFDEYHYNQNAFVTSEKFKTEEEAIYFMNTVKLSSPLNLERSMKEFRNHFDLMYHTLTTISGGVLSNGDHVEGATVEYVSEMLERIK